MLVTSARKEHGCGAREKMVVVQGRKWLWCKRGTWLWCKGGNGCGAREEMVVVQGRKWLWCKGGTYEIYRLVKLKKIVE